MGKLVGIYMHKRSVDELLRTSKNRRWLRVTPMHSFFVVRLAT